MERRGAGADGGEDGGGDDEDVDTAVECAISLCSWSGWLRGSSEFESCCVTPFVVILLPSVPLSTLCSFAVVSVSSLFVPFDWLELSVREMEAELVAGVEDDFDDFSESLDDGGGFDTEVDMAQRNTICDRWRQYNRCQVNHPLMMVRLEWNGRKFQTFKVALHTNRSIDQSQ